MAGLIVRKLTEELVKRVPLSAAANGALAIQRETVCVTADGPEPELAPP